MMGTVAAPPPRGLMRTVLARSPSRPPTVPGRPRLLAPRTAASLTRPRPSPLPMAPQALRRRMATTAPATKRTRTVAVAAATPCPRPSRLHRRAAATAAWATTHGVLGSGWYPRPPPDWRARVVALAVTWARCRHHRGPRLRLRRRGQRPSAQAALLEKAVVRARHHGAAQSCPMPPTRRRTARTTMAAGASTRAVAVRPVGVQVVAMGVAAGQAVPRSTRRARATGSRVVQSATRLRRHQPIRRLFVCFLFWVVHAFVASLLS